MILLFVYSITLFEGCLSELQYGGMHVYKRYFIIDQQIVRHFVQFSESLPNPPSLICNSNN